MSKDKPGPFGLNRTRIMILLMGAIVLVISVSIILGGPGSYQALREASNAANEPTADQLSGE